MINNILNDINSTRQCGNTSGLMTLLDKGYLVVATEHQKRYLQQMLKTLQRGGKQLNLDSDRIITVECTSRIGIRGTRLPLFFDNYTISSALIEARSRMESAEARIAKLHSQLEEKDALLAKKERIIKEKSIEIIRLEYNLYDAEILNDSQGHCIDNLRDEIVGLQDEIKCLSNRGGGSGGRNNGL